MRFREPRRSQCSNRSGQTVIEYILLLAITAILGVTMNRAFIRTFDRSLGKMGATLEKFLKTGKTPDRIWRDPEP